MKKSVLILIALSISFAAFNSYAQEKVNAANTVDEFTTLVNYLEPNTSFLKGELPIIMADEVKKNFKNPKYHIVDLRTDSWYEYGHIKNAANVPATELPTYFKETINPEDFEKIVLICYSGQSAAYYSSLLNLAGYDNVYSMKWGMSAWREDFAANAWTKNAKNDFADKLEATANTKPELGESPVIKTGKTEAKDILNARLEELFATPYSDFIVKSAEVFEAPGDYFVVNFDNSETYTKGHIPGAVQYQPGTSILLESDLLSLPIDKKIALYSATGQEAAYIVAYLNVLGYNTGNIAYGENGFMNGVMKDNDWNAFTKKEINMFPVIE
ncbi:rhodanese-like domain-containing protein [Winogradskyella alexanderae]|uniref:Rhodanese-like domain-containing protein n=1 Tax=Winogradskyella alexanderae TaxID=2877123 RepID=A0ABS7XT02_9FLAO|nr:rhodanese-like domain-containing protein [Winogradskyella alexanderae]MCA0133156.1 rhodanese-like domain-containing protein [Winogradskyella alexanderae]